mmetsp:Transcript_71309/g.64015  ORF Transcript_71309/g.64015 Transcript_71309/m.64015 type:complete len:241 (-) Transcript_71309:39-761(-)|eukprot:CAMPEP_0201581790 /NCGR_PEP_ID=MMETSP0190_2-20130828/75311_1 /ASSEMBLY_ACC=CAM_ASM_000263 /TAXON_ID=37353 /ORGANISM="Rosalina sp." /LENGTH=240 /DNA_ID=CAMNT_0048020457 /DNA_START=118 /DNA_END=840 /DNA_ORIENTATION=-
MSKKDSNKNSKSKKRDSPDEKEWDWSDTALADASKELMLATDVKQLLLTRGEKKQNLKGKKHDMIEFLKEKYDVELKEPIEDLTVKEISCELRLRLLDDSPAKKDILIQRLKGEIDATAPPPKKRKRGQKAKNQPKVYVTLYTPPADEENNSTKVLGVFKSKKKAHEKAIEQLMDDIEKKYGDNTEKKKKKAKEIIEEIDEENDYNKRYDAASEAVVKAYGGKEDDAPYCEVTLTHYDTK